MVPSAAGAVVLVRFPFSDLSQTKLRPAVVLADAGRGDWILCQVTSNPYGDPRAVRFVGSPDKGRAYNDPPRENSFEIIQPWCDRGGNPAGARRRVRRQ